MKIIRSSVDRKEFRVERGSKVLHRGSLSSCYTYVKAVKEGLIDE